MNNLAISHSDNPQVPLQDLATSFAALQQSIEELSHDLQDLLQSAQEMLHSMQTLLDASRAAVQGGAGLLNATHANALLLAPPMSSGAGGGVTGEQQERAAEVREGSMQIFRAPHPLTRRWRVDGGGDTSGSEGDSENERHL